MKTNSTNRFFIVVVILTGLMTVLLLQLFNLTVVKGAEYREISESKRIREVHITAPRGNIYDRNGNILAGTRTSFAVQLLKDELNKQEQLEKNKDFLQLVRFLEEEGAVYMENYPIALNLFTYETGEEYFSGAQTPNDKVIQTIIDNNLVETFLRKTYIVANQPEHYEFHVILRAISALKAKGIDVPVDVEYADTIRLNLLKGEEYDKLSKSFGISEGVDVYAFVAKLIDKDTSVIRKLIDHPLARRIVYDILLERELEDNLILQDYAFLNDVDYVINKAKLNNSYPEITLESSATEDFVEIVTATSLEDLLLKIDVSEDGKFFLPAQYLIEMLEKKGVKTYLSAEINETRNGVAIAFSDEKSHQESPMDRLIYLAKENGVLKDFITDDAIKHLAQSANTENGVNPRISVTSWEYTYRKEKNDLLKRYKLDFAASAEQAFEAMKKYYEIDIASPYEAIGVMSLYTALSQQGSLGYQPLNVTYNISDRTIARIEENLSKNGGIKVAAIPIRHYPERELAGHLIGYLGKISQPAEIAKYTKEKGYATDSLVGKTGIEESFETGLKGKDGKRVVSVDVLGNTTAVLSEEAAVPGNNIYLTLDLNTQRVMEDSLQQTLRALRNGETYQSDWGNFKLSGTYRNARSGASVALDVKTGEVIAMANFPSFDPNLFATGISNTDWESLMPKNEKDPLSPRPLLNTAVQSAIQPGSVYKMATSLAALEKGLDPTLEIPDSGFIEIGDTVFRCWLWGQSKGTHGRENLYRAIRDSCNYYFYVLALGKDPKSKANPGIQLKVEDLIDISSKLGLNEKTGVEINIPAESAGEIPSPDAKLAATKSRLSNELRMTLRKYLAAGTEKSREQILVDIETIASWIDEPELLSRTEVIARLNRMGYNAEIVLQGEKASLTDTIKYNYLNQAAWNITDTLNVVIGQGQNAYTPLQIARYVSAIANGGNKNKVTAVKNIKNFDDSKVIFQNEPKSDPVGLSSDSYFEEVARGMEMAGAYGSNQLVMGKLPVKVAVKTGTAQRDGISPETGKAYDNYSWYVAYAPADDPKIAVATVLIQGGAGSNGAPMTREIIAEYLGLEPGDVEVSTDTPTDDREEGR